MRFKALIFKHLDIKMKSLILFNLLLILFLSCNLSPGYNLNIPPPSDSSWPEDIYPAQIAGKKAESSTLDYGGTEAKYGTDKSIYVARMPTKEEAISFFKQNILPRLNGLSSNFSGTINGQFYAKAKGDSKIIFGWVNHRYIFVLKADSDKAFDELIDNFRYISRK
jgi:hypothetical protein